MSDTRQGTWNDWIGADVLDQEGDKIGTLETIYTDDQTGQPEWLAVRSGLFGNRESFIPIEGAGADGDALRVPYAKGVVKDAPNVDPDGNALSVEEEGQLYQHYGRGGYDASVDAGEGQASTDTPDAGADSAMTRSEEELEVGTRTREAGRVRLRKYVETEDVTVTVPVRKEKVRLEREPITDANRDEAVAGADLSEDEHEVILTEEEPVVGKRVVPKERVRLDKDVEVEDRQVDEQVRKEQIEVEGDQDRRS